MLTEKMDFTLVNIETGAALPIKVRPMRLKDKATLDEWLRVRYMMTATDCEATVEEAEAQVAGLDCISNQWFLNPEKMACRIIYELSKPKMPFSDFYETFFDLSARDLHEDGTENEKSTRLTTNIGVARQAMEWACRNPTETAVNDPKNQTTNTTPQESNGGPANANAESVAQPTA